jgi:hypothetical protein
MPWVPEVWASPWVPEVWASASVARSANPNAAANPKSETIFRRETILDSTSEDICNLPLALAYNADLNQTVSGGGFSGLH